MGVDAVIYAILPEPATEDQIRNWSYRIGAAFGADRFWIVKPGQANEWAKVPHGAIVAGQEYDKATKSYVVNPYRVDISTTSRYYGPGYERGDWSFLRSIIEWMLMNMPEGSTVYYGGDSDEQYLVTIDLMKEIDDHFFKVGCEPYRRYFSEDNSHICPLCKVMMVQFGFGGGYEAYNCLGCGYKLSTKNNGKTWKENAEGVFE